MMNGIYLINKPVGITSFGIVARLRRVLGVKKIGHAGTLDPFAHGLMIVAVGREFTRLIDQYMGMDKTYVATIKLGATSATMDCEGVKEMMSDRVPTTQEISESVARQVKTYDQLPPSFSAKKINGVAAYKLARAGKEVELKTKQVTIYSAELINYTYPYVAIRYRVSSGTYIRVLAHELGQVLGVGAYCDQLCRESIGEWDLSCAIDLYDAKVDTISPEQWTEQLIATSKIA